MPKKSSKAKRVPLVLILAGPTASGKTEVALSLANHLPVEIISADSMQIYRHMGILSQAPNSRILRKTPHHLIQEKKPSQNYNAAQYIRRTKQLINDINARNRIPLIVGGTGLYIKALLDGLFKGPKEKPELRQELYEKAKKYSSTYLHRRLKRKDPEAAMRIHPNDARRLVRALEVISITGKPISELQKKKKGIWGKYAIRYYAIHWEREELYDRINRRTLSMFRKGLVNEVKALKRRKLSKTAKECLGLKEVSAYLEKQIDKTECIDRIQQNTRRLAKRQMTWFNADARIQWIRAKDGETAFQLSKAIREDLKIFRQSLP